MRRLVLAAALVAAMAGPAKAVGPISFFLRAVDLWTVRGLCVDDHCQCGMEKPSEGGIPLQFFQDHSDDGGLQIMNPAWHFSEGRSEVTIEVDALYARRHEVHLLVVPRLSSIALFDVHRSDEFVDAFRDGAMMRIRTEKTVLAFDLASSERALPLLDECLAMLPSRDLEVDPFG